MWLFPFFLLVFLLLKTRLGRGCVLSLVQTQRASSRASQVFEEALLYTVTLHKMPGGMTSCWRHPFLLRPYIPFHRGRLCSCLSKCFAKGPADRLWETLWPSWGVLGAHMHTLQGLISLGPSEVFSPSPPTPGKLIKATLWLRGLFWKLEGLAVARGARFGKCCPMNSAAVEECHSPAALPSPRNWVTTVNWQVGW